MQEEYIIINKTAIQKRIEELEIQNKELAYSDEANPYGLGAIAGKIQELKELLSQSTNLIPEIEKAFHEGTRVPFDKSKPLARWWVNVDQRLEDYISNLKINLWT